MQRTKSRLYYNLRRRQESWAVNGGPGGGGSTRSRTAGRLSASVLLSRLPPAVVGPQPPSSGSGEAAGQGRLGAVAGRPCAPGSQRARLEWPCTSQHQPAGGSGQGYFWRKLCFRPAFPPDLQDNDLEDDSTVLCSANPWTRVRALIARLWGCWAEARMDTPLEAALLAVVEGALRGTSADWTGGGCPQCRRSGGALVRACTVFSRLSGAGTPLVSAVMLSAEKRSSGLGSHSAPRAHRCCPDPQPGVGGACVWSLSLGHSPGHSGGPATPEQGLSRGCTGGSGCLGSKGGRCWRGAQGGRCG